MKQMLIISLAKILFFLYLAVLKSLCAFHINNNNGNNNNNNNNGYF